MSSLKIGTDYDLVIENNNLVLIGGRDEIAQVLRNELAFFYGEWFLDTRKGIDYFGDILIKNPDPAKIDAIFKNKILSSPGVIELLKFNLELENRNLRVTFEASTIDGIISFDEELL
jgi:hypothetical protein